MISSSAHPTQVHLNAHFGRRDTSRMLTTNYKYFVTKGIRMFFNQPRNEWRLDSLIVDCLMELPGNGLDKHAVLAMSFPTKKCLCKTFENLQELMVFCIGLKENHI